MAYGLFLYKEFASKSNKTIRLEIFQKDYAGTSAEIESMGGNPLVLVSDNANSSVYLPIVKSYLDISIVDTNQVDYSVFFTPDATKFKIIVKVNGTPEWSGYLTPDSFEQDLRFKGDISLTARDNLGMLSEFDYDLTNSFYSITTLIDTALTKIGFQFTLEYRINKVDSLDETIRNGLTQSKFWIGKTWQEVLETILTGMGCQMRYVGDNKFAIYDIGYLSSLGTPHTPQTFSFIEQGGNQEIIPAWKVLTINQDYGLGDNIYDGFVEQSDYDFYAYRGGDIDNPYNFYLRPFYTIPLSSDWVSTIPMLSPYEYPNIDPNNLYITGKSPENTLFMSSKLIYGKYFEAISDGKAIQFKFKANNYPHYITQRRSGEYMVGAMLRARYLYTMKVRCNLFAQTATEKYVLQGQRWIPWTISYDDALEFNLPQTKESSVYGKQGTELTSQMDSPQDQDITIEAYGLGESANVWIEFYPYTATYTEVDGLGAVDDYPAIVFDVHTMKLSGFELRIVENEIGGLESKVTINANHNINGAVDLSLGEVPSGLGGYHTYLAGIFKNSHPYYPPMTGFHFTGGTNYKLSELIGREVAHHYKTQKNKLSGTIINSLNFAAMPSFGKTFTDGVKNYALNYGALDFRNETMQVELIEVEDYATDDFTFIDAEIDTGGGESLGSGETEFIQWSAAGNAKRIYELDTASEADQAGAFVFIDKSGLSAAKKVPISSLLVDAYTKTESDSRFASIDGDLTQDFSAKKLTTATLLLPQTAPILASGEVAIYSLDSGFSGEVPSGAGSVTSIALTMPTGFSVSGSPITESGTFGVTFASGYFLPTTTQFATKADVSLIGAANGIAPLDSGGKVALQYLPSTLLKYMGVWDASTNTPTLLATDTARKGQVWNVSVAGTQFGIAFKLGDWLIYNDSGVAEKSDNSDDVVSVNGYTGAVTLKTSDIAEQTNLYYTDARVKAYSDLNYLGISAKAADSDKLDGQDSTYFATATNLSNHASATNNPHSVTAAQVGALALTGGTLSNALNIDTSLGNQIVFSNILINRTIDETGNYGVALAFQTEPNNILPKAAIAFVRSGGFGTGDLHFLLDTVIDNNPVQLSDSVFVLKRDRNAYFANNIYANNNVVYNQGNSNSTSFNWSAAKLTSTTLLLPQTAPTLSSGEMAIYGLESGFSGEMPSGAGSVTSISMVVPTGLSVTPTTITESGTFTISYASGYTIPTNTKQSEWDNAYTLRHNAVTLGTANGLSLSTQELSLGLASTSTNGALSSTDWNTFNGKAAGDHNHDGTYALINGDITKTFSAGVFRSVNSFWGGVFKGSTGSYSDFAILTPSDSYVAYVPVGTRSLEVYGYVNAVGGLSSNGQAVLHAGNYSSYALPLSGGTLSNSIKFGYSSGTMIYSNSFFDMVGWNPNYGTYIGTNVGGLTKYIYADGTFNVGGTLYNLIHSGNIGSQSVNYAAYTGNLSTLSKNEDSIVNYDTNAWHNWAQFSTPLPGDYKYGLHIGSPDTNYNFQLGMSAGSTSVYLRTKNVSYNTWQKIWTDGNLTSTLSNGYLPYWNGSSLVNSAITNTTNGLQILQGGSSAEITYQYGSVGMRINSNGSPVAIYSGWNSSIILSTGSSGYENGEVYIPYGKLGIGYTGRNEKLAVNGDGYFNGKVLAQSEIALLNGGGLGSNGAGASSYPVSAFESYGWNFTIQEIPGGQFGIWNASRTTRYFSIANGGKAVFASSVQMLENINTNLRIPKVAPTSPTSGEYYFYIVE